MNEIEKTTKKIQKYTEQFATKNKPEVYCNAILDDVNEMTTHLLLESKPDQEKEMTSQIKRYKKNLEKNLQVVNKHIEKLQKLYPEKWNKQPNN